MVYNIVPNEWRATDEVGGRDLKEKERVENYFSSISKREKREN